MRCRQTNIDNPNERERMAERKSNRQWATEKECVLPEAHNVGRQCPAVIYRGGVECGSGKEAELPVLGDTGSHCHTVTVGTTHSVVVGRWWLVDWLVGWLIGWLVGWLVGRACVAHDLSSIIGVDGRWRFDRANRAFRAIRVEYVFRVQFALMDGAMPTEKGYQDNQQYIEEFKFKVHAVLGRALMRTKMHTASAQRWRRRRTRNW